MPPVLPPPWSCSFFLSMDGSRPLGLAFSCHLRVRKPPDHMGSEGLSGPPASQPPSEGLLCEVNSGASCHLFSWFGLPVWRMKQEVWGVVVILLSHVPPSLPFSLSLHVWFYLSPNVVHNCKQIFQIHSSPQQSVSSLCNYYLVCDLSDPGWADGSLAFSPMTRCLSLFFLFLSITFFPFFFFVYTCPCSCVRLRVFVSVCVCVCVCCFRNIYSVDHMVQHCLLGKDKSRMQRQRRHQYTHAHTHTHTHTRKHMHTDTHACPHTTQLAQPQYHVLVLSIVISLHLHVCCCITATTNSPVLCSSVSLSAPLAIFPPPPPPPPPLWLICFLPACLYLSTSHACHLSLRMQLAPRPTWVIRPFPEP